MRFIQRYFKTLIIPVALILLLGSCASKRVEHDDIITHSPIQMESVAPAAATTTEKKEDKKKLLKRKPGENDDMERTD